METQSKPKSERTTSWPVAALVPVFLAIIVMTPMLLAGFPVLYFETLPLRLAALAASPVVFGLSYIAIAALLSLPFQRSIIRGKFPRQITHVVYGPRRMYGLCWCAVFYFTPLYYALTSVPILRKIMLWSFGYRGHPDIVIAPDAWVRDLPLLKMGQGAYAANKCTLGTNICLANGFIFVDEISIAAGTMIGHLTMIAPGTAIGEKTEVGVGSAVGIRATIGSRTRIGGTTSVNHGAQIGSGVDIGTMSYIGIKAIIADGVRIPSCANVPEGAEIKNQEDVIRHLSVEKQDLSKELDRLGEIYRSRVAM